jgi:hypothetical protein
MTSERGNNMNNQDFIKNLVATVECFFLKQLELRSETRKGSIRDFMTAADEFTVAELEDKDVQNSLDQRLKTSEITKTLGGSVKKLKAAESSCKFYQHYKASKFLGQLIRYQNNQVRKFIVKNSGANASTEEDVDLEFWDKAAKAHKLHRQTVNCLHKSVSFSKHEQTINAIDSKAREVLEVEDSEETDHSAERILNMSGLSFSNGHNPLEGKMNDFDTKLFFEVASGYAKLPEIAQFVSVVRRKDLHDNVIKEYLSYSTFLPIYEGDSRKRNPLFLKGSKDFIMEFHFYFLPSEVSLN